MYGEYVTDDRHYNVIQTQKTATTGKDHNTIPLDFNFPYSPYKP